MLKGLTSQLMPTVTANTAPLLGHPMQRAEIDLEQHRHDHQPDQHRNRNVDLGGRHAAERLERRRQQAAEHDAGNDAERDPQGEIALEHP